MSNAEIFIWVQVIATPPPPDGRCASANFIPYGDWAQVQFYFACGFEISQELDLRLNKIVCIEVVVGVARSCGATTFAFNGYITTLSQGVRRVQCLPVSVNARMGVAKFNSTYFHWWLCHVAITMNPATSVWQAGFTPWEALDIRTSRWVLCELQSILFMVPTWKT